MDILGIRGENIASLAKPFDIRLDEGPLAGAGLFAITGQTGSGKSSLLDAMCLALYGDCPRLGSAGVNDAVPDVSGEMLQSSDSRTILRRGAAAGEATVRFRGRDGEEYEAAWSVRRAYNKPTNKLQNVDRSVTRLSDGKVLENQIRAVNDKVVELTGLTYEEFRRSVLLAQGDFDSFLSAKTAERAAILEKVTGTGLYREISKRVFAAHTAAERAVQDLEVKLGEHAVLGADERAALEARIAQLKAVRAETAGVLTDLRRDLERHEALDAAAARCALAAEQQVHAEAEWAGRQKDVAQIATLRKAARIRPEHLELQSAILAQERAEAELETQREALAMAKTVDAEATAHLETCRQTHDQIEARFAELGPIWTRATTLDAQIENAAQEEQQAQSAHKNRSARASAAQDDLTKARSERQAIDRQISQVQTALEAEPQGETLLSGWPVLSDRIERRVRACAAVKGARASTAKLEADLKEAQDRKAAIAAALEVATNETSRIESAAADRAPQRAALRAKAPAERLSRLARAAASVRRLAALAERHVLETGHAQTHLRGQKDAREAMAQNEMLMAQARQDQATAQAQIEALEAPAELAEAALSPEARALRRHLEDGQPCPVCHSTDHPVHADEAAHALARDLRERLDAARAGSQAAVTAHATCTARIDRAREDIAQLSARHEAATHLLSGIEEEYRSAMSAEAGGPVADRIPPAPTGAGPSLDDLAGVMTDWQHSLETELETLEALDRQAQQGEAQLAALAKAIRAHRTERDEIDQSSGPMQRRLDATLADIATQDGTRRDLDALLERDFGDLGLAWDIYDDEGAAPLRDLEARKTGHAETRGAMQALQPRKEAAERRIETAQNLQTTEVEAAHGLQEAWQDRRATTKALRDTRAALLNGEETAAHRTAFNLRRKEVQQAKDAASERRAHAASALSAARAAEGAAARGRDEAALRRAKASTALTAALAQTGLTRPEAMRLLDWSAEDIDALETAIKAAEAARLRAEQDLKTRRADLSDLQEAGVPQTPMPDLQDSLAGLEAEDGVQQEELAAIRHQLAADLETRTRMAGIVAQITKAKAHGDTLSAVNDVVGSSSGDRFSTIAQEVTLGILVEQANHHLQDIKPRYRLARGQGKLSLHVVDEHMAGEIRSTRSLSGGERFLVSLALALALSTVGGTGTISGTLFIDEGFGTLDANSLEMAIDALEALQAQGRTIGVISHVQAMQDRIPVQIQIRSQGAGASEVVLRTG